MPKDDVKRRAVRDVMDRHGRGERRACELADLHRSVFQYRFQYRKRDQGDDALRKRLRDLANERRRFDYPLAGRRMEHSPRGAGRASCSPGTGSR